MEYSEKEEKYGSSRGEAGINEVVVIVAVCDGLSKCIFHTAWNNINIWRKIDNSVEKEKIPSGIFELRN